MTKRRSFLTAVGLFAMWPFSLVRASPNRKSANGTNLPLVTSQSDESEVSARSPGTRHFQRVLIVVLENKNYPDVIADPYFASLAARGANLTDFHGLYHPSYENYLAMIAGRRIKAPANIQIDVKKRSIADSLNKAGLTWKCYAEGYRESDCFQGEAGNYVRRHNPFISFTRIRKASCQNIVPATQFADDFANDRLPNYAFYVPDVINDGHDPVFDPAAGLRNASSWLQGFLEPILANEALMASTLVVITFDESLTDEPEVNHVFTVLLGGMITPGDVSTRHNHFSVLRTVEDNFGLAPLGKGDSAATPISGVWR